MREMETCWSSMVFPAVHVWMWELDHKEGWALKSWCFQTAVLEKALKRPLDSKEIKLVNPKGNPPWIFIEGLMLKLKLQHFGRPVRGADSLEKTLMPRKIEGRGRRGSWGWDGWMASPTQWTEIQAHSRRWGGLRSLECCGPWTCTESDMT